MGSVRKGNQTPQVTGSKKSRVSSSTSRMAEWAFKELNHEITK